MKTDLKISPIRGRESSSEKLSKKMKSSSKIKSPECLLKTTRKGNILKHMTSTTNKRPTCQTYQDSFLDTTKVVSMSHEDISGIVPLESCESRSSLLDLTPKITISKCSNGERDLSQCKGKQKTVQRKKIKSPVSKKFSRKLEHKSKNEEYESQLRKKNSEIFSLTRKVNTLQEALNEKNKLVRDLEMKFPKMLSELSRGLGKDPEKLKVSMELKETIKRNRQLSGNQKRNEDLLKIKEDKIKQLERGRDKAIEELRSKEKESRDFKARLVSVEQKLSLLAGKLEAKDSELRRAKEMFEDVQYRYRVINEENFSKIIEIEKMSSQICALRESNEEKNCEMEKLKLKINEMMISLNEETSRVYSLEMQLRELVGIAEKTDLTQSDSDMSEVTKELLAKISRAAKEKNVTLNLQLTVNQGQQNFVETESRENRSTLTNENVSQYEEMSVADEEEEYPEVFDEENLSVGDTTGASNISESEYDVSAGTLAKVRTVTRSFSFSIFHFIPGRRT